MIPPTPFPHANTPNDCPPSPLTQQRQPPGSQGPGPSQVDRTTSCDGSRNGQLGLRLPLFRRSALMSCGNASGLGFAPTPSRQHLKHMLARSDASVRSPSPVDGVLILCSHFRGSTSGGGSCACLPSHGNLPRSHLATPCTQGTNASRVRHSGHGSLSLASGFDAGGTLAQRPDR